MTATIPLTLGTKAQTLQRLHGLLSTAEIPGQVTVTVAQWRADKDGCLNAVRRAFPGQRVIVRSSAPGEDSEDSTCAGMYASVLDVPTGSLDELDKAVAEVTGSYALRHGDDIGHFELLIQPMLTGVTFSGVAFSRDLSTRAPYLVISYDDSGRTDTVTGGSDVVPRVVRIRHGADTALLGPPLAQVAAAVAELTQLLGRDDLDVEWAISHGRLVVLQVRPLPGGPRDNDAIDADVTREVTSVKQALQGYRARRSGVHGSRTAWSTMADWNPAEMIGAHPRPLALSLYQRLITREVWRQARGLLGYHDPAPHQLMITLAGRPYIDLRADFNSYLPAALGDELCRKLIDCYLDRLATTPEAHDKVEFEISPSALDADFPRHAAALADAGLTGSEISQVRSALLQLTMNVIRDRDGQLAAMHQRIGQLPARRRQLLDSELEPLDLADALLTDARHLGTLPFAVTVRGTFIAAALWRSLLRQGVITQDQHDAVLASVRTVSTNFSDDLACCQRGEMPLGDFLDLYGHLRPGTYDITVPSYAAAPELYIGRSGTEHMPRPPATAGGLPVQALRAVDAALAGIGLDLTAAELTAFVRETAARREAYKFAFSANVSAALDALTAFGRRHGLDADLLSYLTVEDLLGCAHGNLTSRDIARLRALSRDRRRAHDAQRAVRLPDVILGERDVDFVTGRHRPNFITAHRVTAPSALVSSRLDSATPLFGRIVLAEHADPGYEFLFSKGIAGLVTRYGGAASHMAIRCAEIGIPAAIGCGDLFNHLAPTAADGNPITLDCAQQLVAPAAGATS